MPEQCKHKTNINQSRMPCLRITAVMRSAFLTLKKMRTEGKVSKVAICEKCNKMVMACHVDYLSKSSEKEFTEFSNEGFIVKIETMDETHARKWGNYSECSTQSCSEADA